MRETDRQTDRDRNRDRVTENQRDIAQSRLVQALLTDCLQMIRWWVLPMVTSLAISQWQTFIQFVIHSFINSTFIHSNGEWVIQLDGHIGQQARPFLPLLHTLSLSMCLYVSHSICLSLSLKRRGCYACAWDSSASHPVLASSVVNQTGYCSCLPSSLHHPFTLSLFVISPVHCTRRRVKSHLLRHASYRNWADDTLWTLSTHTHTDVVVCSIAPETAAFSLHRSRTVSVFREKP